MASASLVAMDTNRPVGCGSGRTLDSEVGGPEEGIPLRGDRDAIGGGNSESDGGRVDPGGRELVDTG
jgi:hypothetical protein